MIEIGKDYIKGECKAKDFKQSLQTLKNLIRSEV